MCVRGNLTYILQYQCISRNVLFIQAHRNLDTFCVLCCINKRLFPFALRIVSNHLSRIYSIHMIHIKFNLFSNLFLGVVAFSSPLTFKRKNDMLLIFWTNIIRKYSPLFSHLHTHTYTYAHPHAHLFPHYLPRLLPHPHPTSTGNENKDNCEKWKEKSTPTIHLHTFSFIENSVLKCHKFPFPSRSLRIFLNAE